MCERAVVGSNCTTRGRRVALGGVPRRVTLGELLQFAERTKAHTPQARQRVRRHLSATQRKFLSWPRRPLRARARHTAKRSATKMAEPRPPALLTASLPLQEDLLTTLQETVSRGAPIAAWRARGALLQALRSAFGARSLAPDSHSLSPRAPNETGHVRVCAKHGRAAGADARALGG